MFQEIIGNFEPERVEYEIDSLTSSQLSRGHKVCIPCNQNNSVDLFLEADRGDIQSDPHINTFLSDVEGKIIIA